MLTSSVFLQERKGVGRGSCRAAISRYGPGSAGGSPSLSSEFSIALRKRPESALRGLGEMESNGMVADDQEPKGAARSPQGRDRATARRAGGGAAGPGHLPSSRPAASADFVDRPPGAAVDLVDRSHAP